jgi:uncharacterized protein (TIGR03437 family)
MKTQILPGTLLTLISSTIDSRGNIYVAGFSGLPDTPLTPGILFDRAVTQRTVSGAFLVRSDLLQTNLAPAASRIGCVTDSVNATLVGPVSPGQLITLYGNGIGPNQPAIGLTGGTADLPTSLAGVSVTFDGKAAPVLYASATQINVQVPFEVFQSTSTVMQLSLNGSVISSRLFAITPKNPGLFVSSVLTSLRCGNTNSGTIFVALALNQDGSVNSCANPARAGSDLSLFVNGTGLASGNRMTGVLTGSKPGGVADSAAVLGGGSLQVVSFTDQAGAISGVGQIRVRVPDTIRSVGPLSVSFTMGQKQAAPLAAAVEAGATVSEIPVVVFVAP